MGLVLDARDAPLMLPRRLDDRREVIAGWLETLLREPVPGRPRDATSEREPARRGLGRFRVGRDDRDDRGRDDSPDDDANGEGGGEADR